MLEELKQRPQRRKVEDEAKQAEERAFNRSYRETRKQIAKEQGAAAGVAAAASGFSAAALEDARQRVLSGGQSTPKAPMAPSTTTVAKEQRFVEVPARGRTYRVPDPQWYSASQEQRERLMDAVDAEDRKKEDDNLSLRVSNELFDLRDKDQARAKRREAEQDELIALLVARIEALEGENRTIKVEASKELAEQLARVSEVVVGAANVETSLRNQTVASKAEADRQRDEHRQRLEATERVVGDQEGRLKSSGQLYQELSNKFEDRGARLEQRLSKAEVRQDELDGGITASRKVLQAVTGTDFNSAIDLAVKEAFDARLSGALEELIERRYVLVSPTTGTDGYDDKRDDLAKPFLGKK